MDGDLDARLLAVSKDRHAAYKKAKHEADAFIRNAIMLLARQFYVEQSTARPAMIGQKFDKFIHEVDSRYRVGYALELMRDGIGSLCKEVEIRPCKNGQGFISQELYLQLSEMLGTRAHILWDWLKKPSNLGEFLAEM